MNATMTIPAFVSVERNALRGFAEVETPSGLIFSDTGIYRSADRWWASCASKPMLGRDGVAIKDATGKIKYSPVVSFASKELRDKFSAAVIDAMRLAHPEIFQS
jgi:hypothetical protein